ncbi:helix-turn-helix domain-containing protein [Paenibacillus sp. IHBB 10380]|uniref:helix-turn-helix domain-containing protein n=1 Tax=Paenibacillus sp. IHBB 10380 TaxID=1566358 RepID=UPI000AF9087E|nr:helix-turn-helix transcriptional regulator [Paenibacillus sp. IHBB 10380]
MPELLISKNLTTAEFARELKIAEGSVSQVISGKINFFYLMAARAAKLLKCKMEDLFAW